MAFINLAWAHHLHHLPVGPGTLLSLGLVTQSLDFPILLVHLFAALPLALPPTWALDLCSRQIASWVGPLHVSFKVFPVLPLSLDPGPMF